LLEGHDVICFAHDWEGDPTSKTHIMRRLATRNRILWVGSIGMRRPRASGTDARRLVSKLRRALAPVRRVEPNLFVANPLTIPAPGNAAADAWNALFLTLWLRGLCARLRFRAPIVWSFLPNVNRLAGRLGERLLIYHCVDEYTAFSGVPREALARMERELVRRADVVLTSSESLCAERQALNPSCHFIPHGVDAGHFSAALDEATAIPEDVRHLPRPIVGFMGLLADWVDLDIVRDMALARPTWSFVLLGRATTDLGPLRGLRNVHCAGPRPYAALPSYCRGFDVGIVPFRRNVLTIRSNPLKVREYLAAGLPVVATPLPEIERFREHVHFAVDGDGFVRAVETALGTGTARMRADAMRAESWERRVEEISEIVATALARERSCPASSTDRVVASPPRG
jgi:glycosyltransferase involved in cell wall biosynthesis